MKKKQRQAWLDNIKLFAIFCVVLGHTLGFLTKHEIAGYELIQGIIVSFNMPLFFMLSGFSSGTRIVKIKTFSNFFSLSIKNTIRILIPAYFLSIITFLLGLGGGDGMLSSYWFLPILWRLLIFFSLCCYINNVIIKRYTNLSIINNYGGIILFLVFSQFLGNRMSEFSTYIVVGFIVNNKNIIEKINFKIVIIIFFTYCLCLIPTIGKNFYKPDYQYHNLIFSNQWYILVLRQFCAIALSLLLLRFFKLYSKKYTKISSFGSMTLGIYLIHDFFIENLLGKKLNVVLPKINNSIDILLVLVVAVLAIIISILLIDLIRRSKFLKLLLLGEDSYNVAYKCSSFLTHCRINHLNSSD